METDAECRASRAELVSCALRGVPNPFANIETTLERVRDAFECEETRLISTGRHPVVLAINTAIAHWDGCGRFEVKVPVGRTSLGGCGYIVDLLIASGHMSAELNQEGSICVILEDHNL
jgi:hypothetical protein